METESTVADPALERTKQIRKAAFMELMEMRVDAALRVAKSVKEAQKAQADRRDK
ncbi:hypothetical protein [Larkinella arboricola]|uniref:hypothetical protein n=1 Tax=Larkinella arboricola TaxID=643671 RepID=UPI0014745DB5|nr:hypothetical protein [Larkinella arboricola]